MKDETEKQEAWSKVSMKDLQIPFPILRSQEVSHLPEDGGWLWKVLPELFRGMKQGWGQG
jgi:hypothetical protein